MNPNPKQKIGVFPRGIDSLFISDLKHELVYLVPENSTEEDWARQFLDPTRILTYGYADKKTILNDQNTTSILRDSNVTEVLKANGVDSLLITHRGTEFIRQWGHDHKIEIVSTHFEHQQKFENKLWFDLFMETHGIPRPKSFIYNHSKNPRMPFRGKGVLQVVDSFGSDGTFFVQSQKEIEALIAAGKIRSNQDLLLRQFVLGKTYGISLFIANGTLALSAIRLQCFYPPTAKSHKVFAGVHWIATRDVDPVVRLQLDSIFEKMGHLLTHERFFGFANFDFIVTPDNRVLVIECNPRLSSATPHLIRFPELISGVPVGKLFLEEFFTQTSPQNISHFHPYPDSDFEGSLLDIAVSHSTLSGTAKVRFEYPNGLYSIQDNAIAFESPDLRKFSTQKPELIYYCEAMAGETHPGTATIGSATSNVPLFSLNGSINALGRRVLLTFTY